MSASLTERADQAHELTKLAAEIKGHHEEALAVAGKCIKAAHEVKKSMLLCGQALLRAKALCGHGGFIKWLESNTDFTRRTAARYISATNGTDESHLDAKCLQTVEELITPEAETTEKTPFRVTYEWFTGRLDLAERKIEVNVVLALPEDQRELARDRLKQHIASMQEVYDQSMGPSPSPLILDVSAVEVSSSNQ